MSLKRASDETNVPEGTASGRFSLEYGRQLPGATKHRFESIMGLCLGGFVGLLVIAQIVLPSPATAVWATFFALLVLPVGIAFSAKACGDFNAERRLAVL